MAFRLKVSFVSKCQRASGKKDSTMSTCCYIDWFAAGVTCVLVIQDGLLATHGELATRPVFGVKADIMLLNSK